MGHLLGECLSASPVERSFPRTEMLPQPLVCLPSLRCCRRLSMPLAPCHALRRPLLRLSAPRLLSPWGCWGLSPGAALPAGRAGFPRRLRPVPGSGRAPTPARAALQRCAQRCAAGPRPAAVPPRLGAGGGGGRWGRRCGAGPGPAGLGSPRARPSAPPGEGKARAA